MLRQPARHHGTARSFWLPGLLGSVVFVLAPAPASAWQYPPAPVRNSYRPARAPAEDQATQDRLMREAMIRRVREQAATRDLDPASPAPVDRPSPGQGGQEIPSFPPPAAEALAPEPSPQEQTGRASAAAAESARQVKEQLARIRQAIEQALAAHERAPAFDPIKESQRIEYFERLLAHAVRLGEQATADEAALRRSFEIWKKASGTAATFFRDAEAHFRAKADQEPYPRASAMYAKTADWYAARAARHELRSELVVPTNFGDQMAELRAMTAASRELLDWVRNDEYMLDEGGGIEADLATYLTAFSAVGDVLSSWTETLLEDLEAEPESDPPAAQTSGSSPERFTHDGTARPLVRPAAWPGPTALPASPTGRAGEDFLGHVTRD